jgi:hypothetical protein
MPVGLARSTADLPSVEADLSKRWPGDPDAQSALLGLGH